MWSQIIQTSRNWARLVWIHCKLKDDLLSAMEAEEQVLTRYLLLLLKTPRRERLIESKLRLRRLRSSEWPLRSLLPSNTTSEVKRACEYSLSRMRRSH